VRYVDEYRDGDAAGRLVAAILRRATRRWTLMEVCGGQTHTLVRYGIDELIAEKVALVHGPGCPVCVTPLELIDRAVAIAGRPEVIFTSFGDMLRVPGSATDLLSVKARGGDVRIVYSPLDAVCLAEQHPEREVVFFAVGFETTAPANAMAVHQAHLRGVRNFSVLSSHVLVPPAMEGLLADPANVVEGFLAAGHVCAIMGTEEYGPIAERHRVPIVVTGFEPLDLLQGILMTVEMLEEGRWGVENQYVRAVRPEGNPAARALLRQVFEVTDRQWRGIGPIPASGLALRPVYAAYDAALRFGVEGISAEEPAACLAGAILRGARKPHECPLFGEGCTPEHPVGAPMVSSEGACAAYYHYRRLA
jgi:hydrogenase expression/formation protein HypD